MHNDILQRIISKILDLKRTKIYIELEYKST